MQSDRSIPTISRRMGRSRSAIDRSGIAKTSQGPGRRTGVKRRAIPARSESWLRLAGVWSVAAKLLLVPLVIDPLGADAFALPKSAVSRGLLYVLCVVGIAYVIRRGRPSFRPAALGIAMIAFVAASGLATLLALDPTAALYGAHRRHLGLTSLLDGAALAAGIALFVRTRGDLVKLGASTALGLTLTIGYGVMQLLGKDPIPWSDTTLGSFVGNSTSFAGYLVVVATVLFGAVLIHWTDLRWPARSALLILVAASVVLVIATGARAPALSLAPSMLFAAAVAHRAGSSRVRRQRRPFAFAAAALLLGVSAFVLSPNAERVARLISGGDSSATERSIIYGTALKAIASRPLLGVGPDGMASVYLALRPAETARLTFLTPTQTSTHSWLFHHALGTGILGLVAFLGMVALAVGDGWRRSAAADGVHAALGAIGVVAYLAQGLVTVNSVVTDMLLWAAIGLAAIPQDPPSSSDWESLARGKRREDGPLAVFALTVGLALALSCANVLEANRAVRTSNLARAAGNLALAERAAEMAVQRDPGGADPWNVLGLAHSRRQPQRAAQAFARASARAPRDPVYLLNLAAEEAVLAERGAPQGESALAHARRAVELDPNGVLTLKRASEVLAVLQQLDEAIQIARRAIDLTPDEPSRHEWLAELLSVAGRPSEAITELERAIAPNTAQAASPRQDLPKELRLRLSRLYRSVGDFDRARSLIRPPTVLGADASCTARNGTGISATGSVRPRCLRVFFAIEEVLRDDGARADSVTNVANYLVSGSLLPEGTTLEYDGARTVTIQLPPGSVPPSPQAVITVRGVADVLGQPVRPASVALQ